MFNRIKRFLGEARQELRHVNWPTRREAAHLTAVVIGISLIFALFLGAFDFVFTDIVKNIVAGRVPSPSGALPDDSLFLGSEDIELFTDEGEKIELGEGAGIEVEPAE